MVHKKPDRKKRKKGIRSPARWLYRPVLVIMYLPFYLFFRLRINRDQRIHALKGPVIVLGNHPSYLDPFFAALALPSFSINFVAASLFFRNKRLKLILDLLGVIPKTQFRSDAGALKQMMQVLKDNGALGIFPEGQRSVDGSSHSLDNTISKLVKKMECPVISIKISGAYLAWPRWSESGLRPGRVEIDVKLLLKKDDIKTLSETEIATLIQKNISFNDYDWQMSFERKNKYLSLAPAAGLHRICHQCPACQKIMAMKSKGKKLFCTICDAEYTLDSSGFISNGNKKFSLNTVWKWRHWQQKELDFKFKNNPSYMLAFNVKTETAGLKDTFSYSGKGLLKIDKAGLFYDGVDCNGDSVQFRSPAGKTVQFSADYGRRLEISHDSGAFRFYPEQGQATVIITDSLILLDNSRYDK